MKHKVLGVLIGMVAKQIFRLDYLRIYSLHLQIPQENEMKSQIEKDIENSIKRPESPTGIIGVLFCEKCNLTWFGIAFNITWSGFPDTHIEFFAYELLSSAICILLVVIR